MLILQLLNCARNAGTYEGDILETISSQPLTCKLEEGSNHRIGTDTIQFIDEDKNTVFFSLRGLLLDFGYPAHEFINELRHIKRILLVSAEFSEACQVNFEFKP